MPKEVFYKISDQKRDKMILSAVKAFTRDDFSEMSVSRLTQEMKILRTDFYYYFKDKEDVYEPVKERFYKTIESQGVPNDSFEALNNLFYQLLFKTKYKFRTYLIDLFTFYSPLAINTFMGLMFEKYEKGEIDVYKRMELTLKFHYMADIMVKCLKKEIDKEEGYKLFNSK